MFVWVITSNADVGSSRMTTLGLRISAIAMTTRCFMPPLSSWGYRRAMSCGRPTRFIAAMACSIASSRSTS